MAKNAYIFLIFCVLDYILAHVDRFYSLNDATAQFFIFDLCTFLRIVLLFMQVLTLMVFKDYFKFNWSVIILYLSYWVYSTTEYINWLDFQRNYLNG